MMERTVHKNDLPTRRGLARPCHSGSAASRQRVSVALLALLFSRVDVARLWTVARTASVPWLVLALALYLAMILVSAWRWGLLLQRAAHRLPVRAA